MKKSLFAALGAGLLIAAAGRAVKRKPSARRPAKTAQYDDRVMHRYISYVALPVWLASAFLDYIWHRRTKIETTSGLEESLLHSLMMAEGGPAVLAALFLEINAGVLAMMISAAVLHEATAIWDVVFSSSRRPIRPVEQHIHSFLEMVPFCVSSVAACMHWEQFLALIGLGNEPADFAFRLRQPSIGPRQLLGVAGAILIVGALPHADELRRCYQAQQRGLVGRDTPECARELFA
jgi:hypothetical protein